MFCKKVKNIKVILVAENLSYLSQLRQMVSENSNCTILAEVTNLQEFNLLSCLGNADLMIISLDSPLIQPFLIAQKATWLNMHLRVLAIKGEHTHPNLKDLIEKGFKGAISNLSQLNAAIENLMHGKFFFPKHINPIS